MRRIVAPPGYGLLRGLQWQTRRGGDYPQRRCFLASPSQYWPCWRAIAASWPSRTPAIALKSHGRKAFQSSRSAANALAANPENSNTADKLAILRGMSARRDDERAAALPRRPIGDRAPAPLSRAGVASHGGPTGPICTRGRLPGGSVDAVADRVLATLRMSQDEALRAGAARRARLQGAGAREFAPVGADVV